MSVNSNSISLACYLRIDPGEGTANSGVGATVLTYCTRAGLRLVDFTAGHTTENEWQAAVRAYHI